MSNTGKSENNKFSERRNNRRFLIPGGIYCFNENDFSEIIDISMGGLSLLAFSIEEWPDPCGKLDLVVPSSDIFVQDIVYRKVGNDLEKNEGWDSGYTLGRCSLHFEGITESQCTSLEEIIRIFSSE